MIGMYLELRMSKIFIGFKFFLHTTSYMVYHLISNLHPKGCYILAFIFNPADWNHSQMLRKGLKKYSNAFLDRWILMLRKSVIWHQQILSINKAKHEDICRKCNKYPDLFTLTIKMNDNKDILRNFSVLIK